METHSLIKKAIEDAVKKNRQDTALSRKLVAWFDELASGNEQIDDVEITLNHLKLLYDNTTLGGVSASDNDESQDQ